MVWGESKTGRLPLRLKDAGKVLVGPVRVRLRETGEEGVGGWVGKDVE